MTENIKNKIISLAKNNPKEEICGLLYTSYESNKLAVFECKNISDNKKDHFEIDSYDYIKCLNLGKLDMIYHSHPNLSKLSEDDKALSDEILLPIMSYGLEDNLFDIYKPKE